MIAVIITAIPGIIAGLFNRWIFLASLFAIIPIIYLVNRFFVIIKWNLVEGIIEDVTLVNDFNQPYTEAHIIFKTKDKLPDGQNLKNQKNFPPYGFFLLSNSAETACNNKNAPLMAVITSSNCDKTDMELSL